MLNKIKEKMDCGLLKTKMALHDFWHKENGDTNFISIAIVLVVVIAIAVVFIAFGKDILQWFKQAIAKWNSDGQSNMGQFVG